MEQLEEEEARAGPVVAVIIDHRLVFVPFDSPPGSPGHWLLAGLLIELLVERGLA